MNYNMADAMATRDAMAKCLYGALFDWIVLQLNYSLLSKRDDREHKGNSIGVLDIFGFEDFARNSFEQFCINYANEHLQYYFNQHIFKFEQEEYVREGIQWKNIEFIDNTGCLTLFSKRRTGLLSLLDEECNFPGGTNERLLAKFHAQHQSSSYYGVPQMKEDVFLIVHYAGLVKYHIQDFREKNSDLMRHDIMVVLKNSCLSFVREIVGNDPVAMLRWAIVRAFFRAYFAFKNGGKKQGLAVTKGKKLRSPVAQRWQLQHPQFGGKSSTSPCGEMKDIFRASLAYSALRRIQKSRSFKPKMRQVKQLRDLKAMKAIVGRSPVGPRASKNKPPSVSCQFNYSLQKMLLTLNEANPFFIRCIKSNKDKAPCTFDRDIVLRQLRYTGMLATVKIRQSGYNYRLTFDEFIQHYKILLPRGLLSSREDIGRFLHGLDLNQENFQIGKTKVFLREAEKMLLDDALHRAIMKRIICIQQWMRARLERKHFLKMRTSAMLIQRNVRGFLAQRKLHHLRLCFYAAIAIQRMFRGFIVRKRLQTQSEAATVIQKTYKGYLAREQYKVLLEQRVREQRREERLRERERERREAEERERTAWEARQREEEKEQKKRHLEAKAETDGQAVTKVSSREDVACDEGVYSRDSEGSSGILDDSESEVASRGGATSSVSTPTTSPRPTKAVHRKKRVSPMQTGRTRTPQVSPPENRLSYAGSVSHLRTQDGPKDLEVHVIPAVIKKASSLELLQTYEPPCAMVVSKKRISAPLAKQESITDSEDNNDKGVVHTISLEPESPDLKVQHREKTHPGDDSMAPHSTFRSPLHRVKKHVFKNLIGGDDTENIEPVVAELPSYITTSPTTKWERCSYSDILYVPEPIAVEMISVVENEAPVAHIPKGVELHMHPPRGHGEVRSLMKRTSHNFSRYTKKSLRELLRQQTTNKKVKNGKNFDEDSDESQVEDGSQVCLSTQGPEENVSGGKKPSLAKTKEAWTSSDCTETSPAIHKPKHRRKLSRKRRTTKETKLVTMDNNSSAATWSVSSTSQWRCPALTLVANTTDLQQLARFFYRKIKEYSRDCNKRDTVFDRVFKQTLSEFHTFLLTQVSTAVQAGHVEFSYERLMVMFEEMLKAQVDSQVQGDSFPFTLGINAFRGYLDEFHKRKTSHDLPDVPKLKKEKKKKDKDVFTHLGHQYLLIQFSIPTFCELCNSFIWMMEKGHVCKSCKYTVHKKCCMKSTLRCKGFMDINNIANEMKVIGAPIARLLEGQKIPPLIERLIQMIEQNGLYTTGIYRKAGAAARIRDLVQMMNSEPENVNFNDYQIHVLTSVIKTFFREMPDPLLTFDLYDEFIRASELNDPKERVVCMYAVLEKLPTPNYDLLERLMFHLATIAHYEPYNRMSANSLAIVFAPSILRTDRPLPAQDTLSHVPKQTICIQCIIEEQLAKLRNLLVDIRTLDSAEASAVDRLSELRASIRAHSIDVTDGHTPDPTTPEILELEEEKKLSAQIISLQQEKDELTYDLPTLECRMTSSEEDVRSTDDLESTADELDLTNSPEQEEYAVTFDLPVTKSKSLRHLTLNRVPTPMKRPPTRRHSSNTSDDDDDSFELPRRQAISLPQLTQIGEEILV
ncbi:hypothetical protein NP493_404g02041 [Ridgeia piscesae]|uniref:Uncharacterized protein n=1 Tax=Ridgeia piscesae TaxID=27915 RepID=A0AAD9L1Z5_RIDPI|nr:hypothetical protein NP493_404g02041 [Ridgeia piscesae]